MEGNWRTANQGLASPALPCITPKARFESRRGHHLRSACAAPSSSGQDAALSRLKHGFDSRRGHQPGAAHSIRKRHLTRAIPPPWPSRAFRRSDVGAFHHRGSATRGHSPEAEVRSARRSGREALPPAAPGSPFHRRGNRTAVAMRSRRSSRRESALRCIAAAPSRCRGRRQEGARQGREGRLNRVWA